MSEYTTHQILEMIEANEGPDGLDLSGKDLSGIDLHRATILKEWRKIDETTEVTPVWCKMDPEGYLVGIDLRRVNLVGANLQNAVMVCADLQQAQLDSTALQGANLALANLREAFLVEANLQEIDLESADLRGANLHKANLQGAHLWSVKLEEAELGLANLQRADLAGANLRGITFVRTNLERAVLQFANLTRADLTGAENCEGIHLFEAILARTDLKAHQLGSALGEELEGKYDQAMETYLALKRNFAEIGRYQDESWAYVKERKMEKATKAPWRGRKYYGQEEPFPHSMRGLFSKLWPDLRQYGALPRWSPLVWWFWLKYSAKWLADWFVDLLCGYGESIWRVLVWMTVTLFGFAAYYWRIGGILLVEPDTGAEVATSFWHYLIYSAGAFTTTQFARFQAADDQVRMVTAIQAIVGIVLAGLLGFVAGNRIRRS